MAEFNFQLKGWPAIAAIVVVVGFIGFKVFLVHSTLGPEELEFVRLQLQAEYAGGSLEELKEAVSGEDKKKMEALASEIEDSQKVEFVSIKARGTKDVVVRLEIEVDGKDPPRGKRVRYFRLRHSLIGGFQVKRETSFLSYYLKLF